MKKIENSHVIITGASGGLGTALCRQLLAAGAQISALDLDSVALDKLCAGLGDGVTGYPLDVTDLQACRRTFEQVQNAHGPADILINNAGITHLSAFRETSPETISSVMQVNFMGAVYCTKCALPGLMARRGQIVVLSSVAGFAPLYGRTGYAASKHALHGFFETLRAELLEDGVNVLMVCPSFVATQQGRPDSAVRYAGAEHPGKARRTVGKTMQPGQAATAIVQAIAKRRELLLLGRVARQSYWLQRFFPKVYERIMISRTRSEVDD